MSRSPSENQVGSNPYAANSSITCQLSSWRPQPRPRSAPPPSVYMIVSRSGQMRSPCIVMSSAVLAITVSRAVGYAWRTPSANFEPPTPPAKITICTAPVFHQQLTVLLHCPASVARAAPKKLEADQQFLERGSPRLGCRYAESVDSL